MISESLCMSILFQNDFYFCMDHNCTPVKADVGAIFFFARGKCETWEILFFPENIYTYLQKKEEKAIDKTLDIHGQKLHGKHVPSIKNKWK